MRVAVVSKTERFAMEDSETNLADLFTNCKSLTEEWRNFLFDQHNHDNGTKYQRFKYAEHPVGFCQIGQRGLLAGEVYLTERGRILTVGIVNAEEMLAYRDIGDELKVEKNHNLAAARVMGGCRHLQKGDR